MPQQQRLAKPWIVGPRTESRLVFGRDHILGGIDGAFQQRPLLARVIGDRGEVVDDARIEFAQHRANPIAEKARIGIRAIETRRDVADLQELVDLWVRVGGADEAQHAVRVRRKRRALSIGLR